MHITEENVRELLQTKADGFLFHRERSDLEFKEQFNFAGLAEYLRDFAAFANNQGGFLIFGVKNSPRIPTGMSDKSIDMFEKIDEEQISGAINEVFSPSMEWERATVTLDGKRFGVIYVYQSAVKPIIAKKDEGKIIKSAEIYYRYAGRTQRIEFAELENIINSRLSDANKQWLDLMARIGKVGPANAAVLDTDKGLIQKNDANILVLDKDLARKVKFIREGEFSEKKGATTLRLVGDVQPIDHVEVTKVLREKLTDAYPYTYIELENIIKQAIPDAARYRIQQIIKDNNLKTNNLYSVYNFSNKTQEERYTQDGTLPKVIPSLYNDTAVQFIVNELQK